MSARQIAVLNRSTVVSDAELTAWCAALQKHADATFSVDWELPLSIKAVPKTDTHSWRGWWNVVMLDNADVQGALGYHELTPQGLPKASVFAKTCYDDGASLTVCLAHEVYEMAVDPYVQLLAPGRDNRLYAYEVCDSIEADEFGDKVDGVLLSDYVLPRFFDPTAKGGKFDHHGILTKPHSLARGGYLSFTARWPNPSWQQVTADSIEGAEIELSEAEVVDVPAAGSSPHADRELIRRVPIAERQRSVE